MRSLKTLLLTIFVLLVGAFFLFFVLENAQPISLLILGWSAPAIPLAVSLLGMLVLGMLMGVVVGISCFRTKRIGEQRN